MFIAYTLPAAVSLSFPDLPSKGPRCPGLRNRRSFSPYRGWLVAGAADQGVVAVVATGCQLRPRSGCHCRLAVTVVAEAQVSCLGRSGCRRYPPCTVSCRPGVEESFAAASRVVAGPAVMKSGGARERRCRRAHDRQSPLGQATSLPQVTDTWPVDGVAPPSAPSAITPTAATPIRIANRHPCCACFVLASFRAPQSWRRTATSRGSGACFDGQKPPTRRYIRTFWAGLGVV